MLLNTYLTFDGNCREAFEYYRSVFGGSFAVLQTFGEPKTVGSNFSISLSPDSHEQCDELFAKLSAGGEVTMALQDTFWGAYFGSCRDRFGINWMVNHGG
jgi:PhnB protein